LHAKRDFLKAEEKKNNDFKRSNYNFS